MAGTAPGNRRAVNSALVVSQLLTVELVRQYRRSRRLLLVGREWAQAGARSVLDTSQRAGSHHSVERCLGESLPFLREAERFALLDIAGP